MSLKEDDLLADDDGGLCLKDDYDDDALLDGEDDLLGPDPSESNTSTQLKEQPAQIQVPVALVAPEPAVKSVRIEPVKVEQEEPLKTLKDEPSKEEPAPAPALAPPIKPVESQPLTDPPDEKSKGKEKVLKESTSSNEEVNDSESDDETQPKVIVHQHRVREQVRDEDDEEEQPRGRSSRFQQERVISTRGGKPRQGIPDSLESVEIPTIGGHHYHNRHQSHHQQQQHGSGGGAGAPNNQFQSRGGSRGRGGRFRQDRPRPYGDGPRGGGRGGIRGSAEHHPRTRHQGPLLRFPPNIQPNNTSPTSNRGGSGGPSGGPSSHGGHPAHGSNHGGPPSNSSHHHQQLAPPPVPPNLNLPPPGFPPPGMPLPPPPLNGPPPPLPLPALGGPPPSLPFPPPPLLPPPPPLALPPPTFPPNMPPPMFANPPPALPPPNLSIPPPPIGTHPTMLPAAAAAANNKPGQKIYVNKNFRPPPGAAPELSAYAPARFDTSIPPPTIGPTGHLSGGYRERSRSPVYRSPPRYRSPPPRERDSLRSRDRRERSRSRSRDRDSSWTSRDRDRDYHRDGSRQRDRFDGRIEHRYRDNREREHLSGPPRDKREQRQRTPPLSKEATRPLDEFELKLLEQKKERERVLKLKEERRKQAARERLSQQQTALDKGQGLSGVNGRPQKVAADAGTIGDSKESKEEKQKRQVILTHVDDALDERILGAAFSKFDVERIRVLRERKAAFVFLRNPRDAEMFCRRNPEFSVGSHVLKVSYAVELAKKRNDGR